MSVVSGSWMGAPNHLGLWLRLLEEVFSVSERGLEGCHAMQLTAAGISPAHIKPPCRPEDGYSRGPPAQRGPPPGEE